MLEDAAYRRLIDAYYTREAPLPIERRACYKLCRAASKDEREAVDYVLDEFFSEHADGWHNTRCDDEIARFLDKQAKAKRSAEARWNKHQSHSEGNANASPNAMRTHSEGNAHQSPDTSNQSPGFTSAISDSTVVGPGDENQPAQSPVARVCLGLKAMGYGDTNPHDPKLAALLDAGMTPEELLSAGEYGRGKSKGFRWVLATAEGRRRDAENVKPLPAKAAAGSLSKAGQRTAEAAARWLESQGVQP